MSLPRTASAVIIGGGVVGCSIAYHLARRGQHDVVVLERETVGSGTTSKAAGGIRVQFPSETEIRFSLESIRVFEGFREEFGVDPGYRTIGYLYLLSEERHLRGFEKRIVLQRTRGARRRASDGSPGSSFTCTRGGATFSSPSLSPRSRARCPSRAT